MSTWEFCQWFKGISLQCPSSRYLYSIWTESGNAKRDEQSVEPMVAGEDYIFNFAKIKKMAGVYTFPEGKQAFDGAVPSSYAAFRENLDYVATVAAFGSLPREHTSAESKN